MADHVGTVAGIYEAFGRGDVPWILDRLADDVEWEQGVRDTGLAYVQPGRGREHVAAFFEHLAANLELTQFEPSAICDGGDIVVVPVIHAGRIVGGGEIPPNHEAHEWHFGPDGRVTAFRHIADWAWHEQAAAKRSATITGRTLRVLEDRVDVLLAGAAFELFRVTGPAESGPPPHAHPWIETYYGLDGAVEVTVDGDVAIVEAGSCVTAAAGALHAYRVVSEQATFLVATSGHRASGFFAELDGTVPAGRPTAETLPSIIEVARRNGLSSPLFV